MFSNCYLLLCRFMVGGRNERVVSEAFDAVANALQAWQNPPVDAFHDFGKF